MSIGCMRIASGWTERGANSVHHGCHREKKSAREQRVSGAFECLRLERTRVSGARERRADEGGSTWFVSGSCLKSCTVYGVLRFCHSVLLRSALGTQQTYRLCCVPLARTLSPCLLPSQTARRPARPSSGRPHLPPPSMERPRGGRDEAAVDQLRRARADPTRGQCRADTSRDSRWCW